MAGTIGIGELLKDRYRLERMLGRGGMAAVWLGRDERLDRPVAVKVLADTLAGDPAFVARFRREATIVAGLSHPNLVGVYDFSEAGERPYLVMQFVPGENLAARLERERELDCDRLARELLGALAHIHEAGILHRDVKPANIVVEPDGTTKLIDFGIALPRDATALTSTGLVLGTERYVAPEVMRGEPATERSDLYSGGVVLRACGDRGSDALRSLVDWLTGEDPRGRPVSARQALARLDEDRSPEPPTQVFEPSFNRAPGSAPQRPRRGRWGAAAALALFCGALVAIAVAALSGDDPSPRSGAGGQGEASGASGESASRAARSPSPTTAGVAEGTDPDLGASLNEEGFALIQEGEYEAAVPVLEAAVEAFPAGTEDLDYAYALFNLGNALRLSGRAEEAVPVLERRLEIPNQTETVEEELAAARAEAG